jgi:hypothetical protein
METHNRPEMIAVLGTPSARAPSNRNSSSTTGFQKVYSCPSTEVFNKNTRKKYNVMYRSDLNQLCK